MGRPGSAGCMDEAPAAPLSRRVWPPASIALDRGHRRPPATRRGRWGTHLRHALLAGKLHSPAGPDPGQPWRATAPPTLDPTHATGVPLTARTACSRWPPQGERSGRHAPGVAVTRSPGPGQPRWSRRLAQALPGLGGRTSPVKNVGKPGAGEPHARFDGRGLETDHDQWHRASPRPSHFAADGGAGR
jgi:hypothetical protein